MALALIVLAIGSVVAGYAGLPSILGGGDWFARYLEPSFGAAPVEEVVEHGLEWTLMLVSIAVAIAGIGIAAYFFLKNRRAADAMAERFSGVRTLLLNKYYVDEIYDATVVQPIRIVSEEALWKVVDVKLIDGGGQRRRPDGRRFERSACAACRPARSAPTRRRCSSGWS